jgi:DNA-binding transcriptional MocR family regulator
MQNINLRLNYPSLSAEEVAWRRFIEQCYREPERSLNWDSPQAEEQHRKRVGDWLQISEQLQSGCSDMLTCMSSNQGLSILLQYLRKAHDQIITEPFTYGAFRVLAQDFGYKLHACDYDEEGPVPDHLEFLLRSKHLRLLYLQPTIHNPTCTVIPEQRRLVITALIKQYDAVVIEDDAYRFLHPDPPPRFIDLVPENTIYLQGLSKPFNPLIKTSYIVFPAQHAKVLADYADLNGGTPSVLLQRLAEFLIRTGSLDEIIGAKREHAAALQRYLLPLLEPLAVKTRPTSYHYWVQLPPGVDGDELVAGLEFQGVLISKGSGYAVGNQKEGHGFVRVAFGCEPNVDRLHQALTKMMGSIDLSSIGRPGG